MSFKKIGLLWSKKDKNENPFYSGILDLGILGQVSVMIFPNQRKETPEQPDASIQLVLGPKEEPQGEETPI